jgi:hypothetical protein
MGKVQKANNSAIVISFSRETLHYGVNCWSWYFRVDEPLWLGRTFRVSALSRAQHFRCCNKTRFILPGSVCCYAGPTAECAWVLLQNSSCKVHAEMAKYKKNRRHLMHYCMRSCQSKSVTSHIFGDRPCGLVVRVPGCRPRDPWFDSQRYHIFWVAVGLERGPLSHCEDKLGATSTKRSDSDLGNWD